MRSASYEYPAMHKSLTNAKKGNTFQLGAFSTQPGSHTLLYSSALATQTSHDLW